MESILFPLLVLGFSVFLAELSSKEPIAAKKAGYEKIGRSINFFQKDGNVLYIPFGGNLKTAVYLDDVISVQEITRNTRLVRPEIRYRKDGMVKSLRASGDAETLLTIEDMLGYG